MTDQPQRPHDDMHRSFPEPRVLPPSAWAPQAGGTCPEAQTRGWSRTTAAHVGAAAGTVVEEAARPRFHGLRGVFIGLAFVVLLVAIGTGGPGRDEPAGVVGEATYVSGPEGVDPWGEPVPTEFEEMTEPTPEPYPTETYEPGTYGDPAWPDDTTSAGSSPVAPVYPRVVTPRRQSGSTPIRPRRSR